MNKIKQAFLPAALHVRETQFKTIYLFGGYYRHKDAFAPFIGVDYKSFLVGLSYDMNISKLGAMAKRVNSFELSFTYVKRRGEKSLFDFIHCPRL